jgi:hypothetical protein
MWPSPSGESYFAFIVHGITAKYDRVELLLDFDVLGCEHTAANQGQRIRTRSRLVLGMEPEALLWMVEADNTASAANLGPALGLQEGRCSSHIYNLSARHLLFLVKRRQQGRDVMVPHEKAVERIVELCEKFRQVVKYFKYHEDSGRQLLNILKAMSMKTQVLHLDSSSAWSSTLRMLEVASYGEPALLAYGARVGYPGLLTQEDFDLAREVIGVLRPLADTTNASQACSATGSQVLLHLYSLRDEYRSEEPTYVPQRGDFLQTVPVASDQLSLHARDLRQAIADDIETNERHLTRSRDVLLKATVVDPRFRLRALSRWLSPDEQVRVREMVFDEIISSRPAGSAAQAHVPIAALGVRQQSSATERANKRLRRLQEGPPQLPALLDADAQPIEQDSAWKVEARAVFEEYLNMSSRVPDVAADPLDWFRRAGQIGHASLAEERLLRPLVRRYLAIPGSNHRIERAWSSGRHFMDYTKSGLDSATVCDAMLLHQNSARLGLWPPQLISMV